MMVLIGGSPRNNIQEYEECGNIGNLLSPGKSHKPRLPYSLDNRKFADWNKGNTWNADLFKRHVGMYYQDALWIVVPDFVADRQRTIDSWYEWEPWLRQFNRPLAIAAQNGMNPSDIPKSADVIFVGGTDEWKLTTAPFWCASFSRVHIARVTTWHRLILCHKWGAESVDGTGWFMGGMERAQDLLLYLRWQAGLVTRLNSFESDAENLSPTARRSLLQEPNICTETLLIHGR
jgi:hypothetical protein